MANRAFFASLVVFAFVLSGCPEPKKMSYLDNGVIRVGVDLNMGGVITYLADFNNQDINLVNSSDQGREIQPSYYAGPQPYGDPHPGWPNWPWNPIGAGDCYGNRSEVVEKFNDGTTIYVKSIPLQWALDNVPCECVFEQWIELDGNAVEVHYKLTNARADHTDYGARHQELPAVYTTDRFHRIFTYNGGSPFTGRPVEEIANSGPPWAYFDATEKWAALVQDNGWGLGRVQPRRAALRRRISRHARRRRPDGFIHRLPLAASHRKHPVEHGVRVRRLPDPRLRRGHPFVGVRQPALRTRVESTGNFGWRLN